jgi:hypothetical protein
VSAEDQPQRVANLSALEISRMLRLVFDTAALRCGDSKLRAKLSLHFSRQ